MAKKGRGLTGELTRRELCLSLSAMALSPIRLGAQALKSAARSLLPVPVSTLNHMTFSCPDLGATTRWYQRVLGMPIMYNQHFLGRAGDLPILRIGDGRPEYVALSTGGGSAPLKPPFARVRPHFCWGVKNFDADRLLMALSENNVPDFRARFREANVLELNFSDPDGFPLQFIDESGCGGGGYLADVCSDTAFAFREPGDPPSIRAATLNHVTYMVPSLKRSLDWYQKMTDAKVVSWQEREGGPRTEDWKDGPVAILRVGTGPQHLVFYEGTHPLPHRAHIGLGVNNIDFEKAKKRLDEHGVKWRIRVREGVTSELLVDGPDYIEIQLVDAKTYNGGGGPLGNILNPNP
jgi:catechol 2,3-dioxygenase-like lactoylglutathione lyase family enzyme